ncbi:uncharacterized protein V1510DRAFT_422937 [Dipodascopsis tothii]|uniref:uncharacterized protein n=1 Tax=Dipodascopsis tothii TaxID=44089 RepID=UPI0034CF5825
MSASSSREPRTPVLLITPDTLPTIQLQIHSSRMRNTNKLKGKSDEALVLISIRDRAADKEWWKVSKTYTSLATLDSALRPDLGAYSIPRLPEKSMFSSLAPNKVDDRKQALEKYFATIMSIPALHDKSAMSFCEFLSTDIIDPMAFEDTIFKKEGYLTKQGKKLGGWKMRYFILHESALEYFESPGGPHLGSIKLDNGLVTPLTAEGARDYVGEDKAYRHALVVMERNKRDGFNKHVLCAESDEDRDSWVSCILEDIENSDRRSNASDTSSIFPAGHLASPPKKKGHTPPNILVGPIGGQPYVDDDSSLDSRSPSLPESGLPTSASATFPSAGTPLSAHFSKMLPTALLGHGETDDEDAPGLAAAAPLKDPKDILKKQKKKSSFFNFKKSDPGAHIQLADQQMLQQQQQEETRQYLQVTMDSMRQSPMIEYRVSLTREMSPTDTQPLDESMRATYDTDEGYSGPVAMGGISYGGEVAPSAVFGVPLAEAVIRSYAQKGTVKIPLIVYRCIEYLEAEQALFEEGVFRLSGSSSVIKFLKERFNTEADVNLLEAKIFYDVHAVAGLLKLYLRELPSNVLANQTAFFNKALEISDRPTKLKELHAGVRLLPHDNFSLLKALSRYLINIVEKSEKNKMNLRNVGIVFSPTLNISVELVTLFIKEYIAIFIDKPVTAELAG